MKKAIGLLLSLSMAGTMMAAAVPAFAEEAEPEVTITYWGWDSNFSTPVMEAYHELHPNVTFEATPVEWGDMLTKVQQALASGSDLPTIIPMDRALIENWKAMGIMENLYDYGFDSSMYNQALIDAATTEDGELIGLFENVCPAGIAYKRDLAEQYLGTSDPEELQAMFQTYDDYVTKGAEVAEASDGEVYLFHSGQAVAEWLYFASDVNNVDEEGNVNITEKFTDIFSKLIAMRDAGAVDSYQSGTAEGNACYADDTHIFFACPDWSLTYYVEANDPEGCEAGNWGLIQAPVDYQHGGTAMGITSSATDEEKAAAYDFITWAMGTEEGATVLKNEAGYITTNTEIATPEFAIRDDEDVFGGEEISNLFYQVIAPNTEIAAPSIYDNDITSVRNDVATLVMDDPDMTVEDAVAAALEEMQTLVNDDSVVIK